MRLNKSWLVLSISIVFCAFAWVVWADPGNTKCLNGNGKGGSTARLSAQACEVRCPPPPSAGCVLFECTPCGCDYTCADGTMTTLDLLPEVTTDATQEQVEKR